MNTENADGMNVEHVFVDFVDFAGRAECGMDRHSLYSSVVVVVVAVGSTRVDSLWEGIGGGGCHWCWWMEGDERLENENRIDD